MSASSLDKMMATLGYSFANPELLERALTHRSYANEVNSATIVHNERLEFLGDAVVDLSVATRLMEALPEEREGRLSRLRSMIVSEPTMAKIAESLAIGEFLRLGRGEEISGGRSKPSLLADAFEAVLGAVYLDGGFVVADEVASRLLGEAIRTAISGSLDPDYKSRLQELVQARFRQTPRYAVTRTDGPDHARVFEVTVSVGDREMGRALGPSKKEAEQEAARIALGVLDTENS